MGIPLSAASSLMSLFLVFWTGSAWFAAIHPRLARRWFRSIGIGAKPGASSPSPAVWSVIGFLYGAAGLLLLALPQFLK